jgi:predicted DNA-binding protein with PD1-like motif
METLFCREYSRGRRLLGRLPHGQDLIKAVTAVCRETGIQMAAFAAHGAVSSVTLGVFDQQQQVYVTAAEEKPFELVICQGHVSPQDGNPFVYAHGVLADTQGQTIGGRLFSDTLIFAAEIDLQELTGEPLNRHYDPKTGLMLWHAGE